MMHCSRCRIVNKNKTENISLHEKNILHNGRGIVQAKGQINQRVNKLGGE